MNKFLKILIWIDIPILIVAIGIYSLYQKDLDIYPSNQTSVYAYSDKESGMPVFSKILLLDTTNNVARVEYELHTDSIKYPYAGIGFRFKEIINFKKFNRLLVNVNINRSKSVICNLGCKFIHPQLNKETGRIFRVELPQDNSNEYVFSLKDFATPPWWFNEQQINQMEAGDKDISATYEIQFGTGNNFISGEKNFYVVKSISLIKDNSINYAWLGGFTVLYFALLYFIIKYSKKSKPKFIPYQELNVVENSEEDKIIKFINTNYHDPKLSLDSIQSNLGYSPYKVSQVLKKRIQLSFKQYINNIRITEAKRLLKETDLQVMEVAYKTGYNTITHFNKVFKDIVGETPNSFRS